jgi:hypothetical protein
VFRRFSYDPCPYCGDHFPCRPNFSVGGSYTHFEPKHLDDHCFPCRGLRPTGSNGEM